MSDDKKKVKTDNSTKESQLKVAKEVMSTHKEALAKLANS